MNPSDYLNDPTRRQGQEKDRLAALQAAITAGMESGPSGELDMEAIKRKARQLAGLDAT